MFAVNYLLFDLVNLLGILIWSLSHNVWYFYLHFKTFKLDLGYCFLPCLWHSLSCIRSLFLSERLFWLEKYQLKKFFYMCFVIFFFPSVNSGYFCKTLVIFVLVVEVGLCQMVFCGSNRSFSTFIWGTITLSFIL